MLSNFKKIFVYNPFHDFVAYFVPVFTMLMFGYYTNYPEIKNFFAVSQNFNLFAKLLIILILLSTIGRVLYEITSYALDFIHRVTARIIHSLGKRTGLALRISKSLYRLIPTINEEEVPETILKEYLETNRVHKLWYARTRMFALSLQTGLGVLMVSFVIYERHQALIVLALAIIFLLALKGRGSLSHAETELEEHIQLRRNV